MALKQLEVAKELDDCFLAIKQLVSDMKAKKSLAEIVASSLPALMAASEGLSLVDDELKQDPVAFAGTVGYRAGELAAILLKK